MMLENSRGNTSFGGSECQDIRHPGYTQLTVYVILHQKCVHVHSQQYT